MSSWTDSLPTERLSIRHYNTMKIMVVVLSALLIVNFIGDFTFRQSQIEINENFFKNFELQQKINDNTNKALTFINQLFKLLLGTENA